VAMKKEKGDLSKSEIEKWSSLISKRKRRTTEIKAKVKSLQTDHFCFCDCLVDLFLF
jgi:hypothetical protein